MSRKWIITKIVAISAIKLCSLSPRLMTTATRLATQTLLTERFSVLNSQIVSIVWNSNSFYCFRPHNQLFATKHLPDLECAFRPVLRLWHKRVQCKKIACVILAPTFTFPVSQLALVAELFFPSFHFNMNILCYNVFWQFELVEDEWRSANNSVHYCLFPDLLLLAS
jgi:hypothetical protein